MIQVSVKDAVSIKMKIAQSGYTLRGFSREVGVSHSYLSQILNGRGNPSPAVAKKISKGLGKEINEFFLISLVDGQPKEVNIS